MLIKLIISWDCLKMIIVRISLINFKISNGHFFIGLYRLEVLNSNLQNQEPLLTDMVRVAIKMLQKEEKGFVLLVEGGRIDHAHHSNYARRSLDETAEFARAVELAKTLTSEEDTLIVASADHSHVFTYNGKIYDLRPNVNYATIIFCRLSMETRRCFGRCNDVRNRWKKLRNSLIRQRSWISQHLS